MSNFGSLNLNISKATPTTSTTNTNTTSLPVATTSKSSSKAANSAASESSLSFLRLHNNSPEISSSMGGVNKTSASGDISVTPTKIPSSTNSAEKSDLINIFEKFSIEPIKNSVERDSIEEKFEQFKGSPNDENSTNENEAQPTKDEAEKADSDSSDLKEQESPQITEEASSTSENCTKEESQGSDSQSNSPTNDIASKLKEELPLKPPVEPDNSSVKIKAEAMSIQPYIIEDTISEQEETTIDTPGAGSFDDKIIEGNVERIGSPVGETNDFLNIESNEPIEEMQIELSGTSDPEVQVAETKNIPQRPNVARKNSIVLANKGIVNASEQHQQSHRPFDFQVFLAHLKKKSADPIVRYIRSFLMSFARQASSMRVSQMVKAIRNFKQFIENKFHEYEPFASMNDNDLENSIEGVEKLIMNRLYDFCFPPEASKKLIIRPSSSMARDLSDDAAFADQTEKFSWVSGVHLDVDLDTLSEKKRSASGDDIDYMEYATLELNKLNRYRAPRDKIICILNACKILFSLLRVTSQETNADAFIPLLILVILKAKTDHIISNLHYIENFRGEKWLNHGETSYYLSTMQGAIKFIQNIQKEDLTIDEAHFDAHMEAWDAEVRQRGEADMQSEHENEGNIATNSATTSVKRGIPPSSVLKTSAEMFSKSLSNLISPSPEAPTESSSADQDALSGNTEADVDEVFAQLSEIFPSLDKDIMRDIIVMNKADLDTSLDVCLQLVQEA